MGKRNCDDYLTGRHRPQGYLPDLGLPPEITAGSTEEVMTRDEWEALKATADKFYSSHSDEQIAAYNASRLADYSEIAHARSCGKCNEEISRGFVYLLKGETGLFKIGSSRNLNSRVADIVASLPFSVQIIHSAYVRNRLDLERRWHRRFAEQRVRGEWFRLSEGDVGLFCTMRDELQRPYGS
jgi:hypothetical protein